MRTPGASTPTSADRAERRHRRWPWFVLSAVVLVVAESTLQPPPAVVDGYVVDWP